MKAQEIKYRTTVDCNGMQDYEYPNLQKKMYIECYNGTKGIIVTTDNYYSILDSGDTVHRMDIKLIKY